jgi:hypothetical protein
MRAAGTDRQRTIWEDPGASPAFRFPGTGGVARRGSGARGPSQSRRGEYFGPCRRDGTCAGRPICDAREYVSTDLEESSDHSIRAGYLNEDEQAIVRAARALVPAFEGEVPVPVHRDYCPANWLVTCDGVWAGVIDFEFAYWDMRVADFTRYPDWDWIGRPDLVEAFFDGYGRSLTPEEGQQRLVA